MGMTVFHKPNSARGLVETIVIDRPAAAVVYAKSGATQVDAIVFNAAAVDLLDELGAPSEVELLYDPATNEVGIRPWVAQDCPISTCHPVHPTRFVSSDLLRARWPRKVECPQFINTWHLPEVLFYRPSPARLTAGMFVFNPRRVMTP